MDLLLQLLAVCRCKLNLRTTFMLAPLLPAMGKSDIVTTVVDRLTVNINAPFSVTPSVAASLATTSCYQLATQLNSLSIYDYWDSSTAVSRLLVGVGVDHFQIDVKGDLHELTFSGPAADLLDSCSGDFGNSGISSFPGEPDLLVSTIRSCLVN